MVDKSYNVLGMSLRTTLCHTSVGKDKYYVYMEPITEEQEKDIDESAEYFKEYRFCREEFDVQGKDIYMFGLLDINNEEDLNLIISNNLINGNDGSWIISDFDYDTGAIRTRDGIMWKYPTYDPILYFKYCHLLIGKPERIIIYRKKFENERR